MKYLIKSSIDVIFLSISIFMLIIFLSYQWLVQIGLINGGENSYLLGDFIKIGA